MLTFPDTLPLGAALDAPGLTWSVGGNAVWTPQTSVTHDGTDAAQSGVISHSQESWVQTTVIGPGTLSFWWKVSSESGYDHLEFYTNGVCATQISGEMVWQKGNYELGPGTQMLRWRYKKDGSDSSGQDRGWVDEVTLVPLGGRPVIITNDGHLGVRSNRFGFNVSGTTGQILIVEGSTNLLNWLPLQTNTLGGGLSYFSDPVPSVFPWRFYRVRTGP